MALTKITNDLLDLGSDTGALELPKGTEAQRPSNPVEGTLRHNSEIDETKLETYNGTEWRKINKAIDTTPYSVDWLVVAGGGGGGNGLGSATYASSGAGAGGLRTSYGTTSGGGSASENSLTLVTSTQYTITVGAGGARGFEGGDSWFSDIISIGGGSGVPNAGYIHQDGGSGGGSGDPVGTGSASKGFGTSGQGFDGGVVTGSAGYAGGGGGASQAGNGTTAGNGLAVNIISTSDSSTYSVGEVSGSDVYFSGGGGGGSTSSSRGLGGGGFGGTVAYSGSPNTGGGGGGKRACCSSSTQLGQPGGSGVVILRMLTANYSGTTTGSPIVTTDGTDTILTYTSSGTYTA